MEPTTKRKLLRILRDVGLTFLFGILSTFNVLFSRGENQTQLEEYYMRLTRPAKAEKILSFRGKTAASIKA